MRKMIHMGRQHSIRKETIGENRRIRLLCAIHSQLRIEKIRDIYRRGTTLSTAYLNNQIEMEAEMRVW